MNTVILTAEIHREHDLVFIRRRARHICNLLGLSTQDRTRVATAVSELARNALKYAGRGRVRFEVEGETPESLVICVSDEGPGIADLESVLSGDYVSPGGMGHGITGTRRLMDRFEIDSSPEHGTSIVLAKSLPDRLPQMEKWGLQTTPAIVNKIVEELTNYVDPSPVEEMQDQNQALLQALADAEEARTKRDELIEDLQRTVHLNEMFVGVVSHDLRNPLTAITMAASVLQFQGESEAVSRSATRILNSAERMSRLINEILDITQIRLGSGLPLDRGEADLGEVATMILAEFQDRDAQSTDTVAPQDIHYEHRGDLTGHWDSDRLSQVLSNLLGNARKHGEDGAPIKLRIDGSGPDCVKFTVNNLGKIPEESLPHIFQPLRSEKNGHNQSKSKNLGLGLYITQQIVVAHGGGIDVTSDDAHGTTFSVCLPREPAKSCESAEIDLDAIPTGLDEISWVVDED